MISKLNYFFFSFDSCSFLLGALRQARDTAPAPTPDPPASPATAPTPTATPPPEQTSIFWEHRCPPQQKRGQKDQNTGRANQKIQNKNKNYASHLLYIQKEFCRLRFVKGF